MTISFATQSSLRKRSSPTTIEAARRMSALRQLVLAGRGWRFRAFGFVSIWSRHGRESTQGKGRVLCRDSLSDQPLALGHLR
jgi:hypothetical protein